jgi:kynurenine 3-monooxygenase
MSAATRIVIVGGGLAGSLLAVLLARRGLVTQVLERAAKFDAEHGPRGRSINLALAARGIEALRAAGVYERIAALTLPMKGRMVHEPGSAPRFARYGLAPNEQIYSVSRAELHVALYRIAVEQYGVDYRFGHNCTDVDPATGRLRVETAQGELHIDADVILASDGAGSTVRRVLAERDVIDAREELLDHGYKEFTIPPVDGGYALDPEALHIWPRGDFMLIALPNMDRSFTATLFLPHRGETSFERIATATFRDWFGREFADVAASIPALEREYAEHPTGVLGTVRCTPWQAGRRVLLLGDAAHAIVPFHGQGMNAAFEDCRVLDELIAVHEGRWADVFTAFEARRADNAHALAEMALDNYTEMRDLVRDKRFQLKTQLGFELERRFPGRWLRRYSMVMFHPDIEYAEARRRGAIQERLLNRLTLHAETLADVDFALAARLLEEMQ